MFEPGTKVKAVDVNGESELELGAEYVVSKSQNGFTCVEGVEGGFFHHRFEAIPKEPEPKPDEYLYVAAKDTDTVDTDLEPFEEGDIVYVYKLMGKAKVAKPKPYLDTV